jgi:hypothetical protein
MKAKRRIAEPTVDAPKTASRGFRDRAGRRVQQSIQNVLAVWNRIAQRAAPRLRPWLLLALVALVVARPLVPSEGVSWLGDGQPFNLLTILLAAAYCLLGVLEGGFARLNLLDAVVAVLIALCATSAFVGAQAGDPRLSLNMLWEWVALGLVYFLARQLVRGGSETRALVAAMIALSVVMAGYGFFQVFVSLPADRAAYAASPDAVMREMGQWFPPGSPERVLFENRLQSTEPLATFALANSLAGFLAPWLAIALAIGWNQFARGRRSGGAPTDVAMSRATLVVFALCLGAVAWCLVLTKSRSAYLAVAVGAALAPWIDSRSRPRRRFAAAMATALLLAVAALVAALAAGALDAKVFTEAGKSLGYRLEYWRATLAMIARYPWLGVGPGNFQDYYTQFKLPQASEEIQDPHNFLLEVWATCGTFALIALCNLLGVFAWRTWNLDVRSRTARSEEPPASVRSILFVVGGGAAGFVLAFLMAPAVGLSFTEGLVLGGLVIFGGVVAVLWPWIVDGPLPPRAPALGVLVLAINLLAAGGVSYPGVAGSMWLLLALGVNELDSQRGADGVTRSHYRFAAWGPAVCLALVCAALLGCYFVAYRPVLRAAQAMALANEEHLSTDERINRLVKVAEADPIAAEPWGMIAELEVPRLKSDPNSKESSERFVLATRTFLELRPHTSSAWRQAARWHQELYQEHPGPGIGEAASGYLQRAVELYPNLALLRAEYALVLDAVGDAKAARQQIAIARQLDGQTPHADKKLSPEVRRRLDAIEARSR